PPANHRPLPTLRDDHAAAGRPAEGRRDPPYRSAAQSGECGGLCRSDRLRHDSARRSRHARLIGGKITAKLEEANMEAQQTSLYERLGGIYVIATAVDDFIDRIMVDDRLNANPRVDEAHHRVSPPGFKYLVTEQVGEASGGPQRYTGRSME